MTETFFCYATGQQCNTPCELGQKVNKVVAGDDYFRWVIQITEQVEGKESERAKRGRDAVGIDATKRAEIGGLICPRQLPLLSPQIYRRGSVARAAPIASK